MFRYRENARDRVMGILSAMRELREDSAMRELREDDSEGLSYLQVLFKEEEEDEDKESEGVPTEYEEEEEEVEEEEEGSISVILTHPDVLDCPICLESLSSPVFQCENGHIACYSCCIKVLNKCPSCSRPIGYIRCRAIERVLESVKVRCSNMKYGCNETLSYSKKLGHEKTCMYTPCSCPLPDCDFVGSSMHLSLHFRTKHPDSAKHFYYDRFFPVSLEMGQKQLILQAKSEGIIFVLNNGAERIGNVVNVSCIGPISSKRGFSYDLMARHEGSSVMLQSVTEFVPNWIEHHPQKVFLLVPSDFIGSRRQLNLELCIRRHHESPAQI